VVKEFSRSSLRYAEDNYPLFLFGERVDHSVIHYWDKRLRNLGILEKILMMDRYYDVEDSMETYSQRDT